MNAAALIAVAFNAHATSLNIEDYRSGLRLGCVLLKENRFDLSFIHSVSLTPVKDVYEIQPIINGSYKIKQTKEFFIAHGQGLPSMQNEPDVIKFEHHDGQFILHLDRPINDLIVRLDKRFKNRLHTGQNIINLNQWSDDTGLRIKPVANCE